MIARMGRPRKAGNRDLPPGLYADRDGYYYIIHPITKARAYLSTKDKERAKELYWTQRATWDDELLRAQAEKIVERLSAINRPAGKRTFADYAKYYRTEKLPKAVSRSGRPLADHTREDYRRFLKNAVEPSEHFQIALEQVDEVVLRKFLSQWLDSPAHYNYVKSLLSRVCKCAIDEGLLRRNPVEGVSRRPTARREVYIPDDDYAAITSKMEEWEARACDLIYFYSHRPGDVLRIVDDEQHIRKEIIDGNECIVVCFTATKNNQPMEITDTLDGPLATTIEWFRQRKRDQGFVGKHLVVYPKTSRRRSIGKPVSAAYISRRFAEAVVAAGFDKGKYQLRDLRKKGLTDEARLAGKPTEKGGWKSDAMKRYYVVGELPIRARNNLRQIVR